MNCKRCIAVIGLSPLKALGMLSLLRDSGNGKAECFPSFSDFNSFAGKTDAYIVSSDIFACNADFFLPRRQKTLLVAERILSTEEAGMAVVSESWDVAEIMGKLSMFLSDLDHSEDSKGELSSREIEVLRLIASGKINKEIADELCISVNTVISHRKNISAKLGVKSASGLSLYAMMNGLI